MSQSLLKPLLKGGFKLETSTGKEQYQKYCGLDHAEVYFYAGRVVLNITRPASNETKRMTLSVSNAYTPELIRSFLKGFM